MRRRMHQPIPEQGTMAGASREPASLRITPCRPTVRALHAFRHHVTDLWRRTLQRRSQKDRMTWQRIAKLAADYLPAARNPSSLAADALCRHTPKVGAACLNCARSDLCGGRSAMSVPCTLRVA